ncbi:MAG: nucleotidyltransferase domain-containing protein [Candidatus Poribacteria bacterium]
MEMLDKYRDTLAGLRKEFVEVCKAIFGDNLVAIVNKGSSVKGGFIPGLSDVDLHVYLKEEAFTYSDLIKLELGLSFQEKMDKLIHKYDVGDGPIQVIFLNVDNPKRWSGPLPGTYLILYGDSCPEPEPHAEEMLEMDRLCLRSPSYFYNLINTYADKANEELADFVRKINPAITPALYRVLSLITNDPLKVWKMTRFEVLEGLESLESEEAKEMAELGREYFEIAGQRPLLKIDPELCRKALRIGFKIIDIGKEFAFSLGFNHELHK